MVLWCTDSYSENKPSAGWLFWLLFWVHQWWGDLGRAEHNLTDILSRTPNPTWVLCTARHSPASLRHSQCRAGRELHAGSSKAFGSMSQSQSQKARVGTGGVERTVCLQTALVPTAKHTNWPGRKKAGLYLEKKKKKKSKIGSLEKCLLLWKTNIKQEPHPALLKRPPAVPAFPCCHHPLCSLTSQVLGFVTGGSARSPGEPHSLTAAQTCKTHARLGCCHLWAWTGKETQLIIFLTGHYFSNIWACCPEAKGDPRHCRVRKSDHL